MFFRQFITALLAAVALNAFAAVDINRASRAELETVKGIGPGLSAKILKARESGEFKNWSDMVQRVPGVGAASAGKLSKAGLTVGGAAFDAGALPAAAIKTKKARSGDGAETTAATAGTAPVSDSAKPARKAAKKEKAES